MQREGSNVAAVSTASSARARERLDDILTGVGRRIRAWVGASHADGPRQQLDALTAVPNLFTLQTIRVAVTLGLPDLIDGGIGNPADLAAATGTHPDALARLIRHLHNRGVFTEPSPGLVDLSEIGRLLLTSDPEQQAAYFRLDAASVLFDAVVREMMYSIRTGLPAWSRVHREPFWEYVARSSTVATSFDQDMFRRAQVLGPELVAGYDWEGVSVLVDVGGGNGTLIAQLLTSRKSMHGTIVEAAAAIERIQSTLREAGLLERCDIVAGSFFEALPAGGDVYLLSWVLHDWGDDDAVRILTRCREAAGPSGRVLVVEQPLDVVPATELDLRMLLYFGGRERTRAEYERLARLSGFTWLSWTSLPSDSWILDCRTS
jgi:hypothetical protein